MTPGTTTEERTLVDYKRDAPEGYRALAALTRAGKMDLRTVELVKLLASRINRCAHCVRTHEPIALEAGETEERLAALEGWRESELFDERERAAFALTEELTRVGDGVSPRTMGAAARWYPDDELSRLVLAIVAINAWNRAWIASEAGEAAAAA